jgi:hypothetical protein
MIDQTIRSPIVFLAARGNALIVVRPGRFEFLDTLSGI